MTYKVLSLKWRPQSFKEIVGQDHVSKTLVNSIIYERIGQGYIFTGPRGVGKTTTARILAMALNSGKKPSLVLIQIVLPLGNCWRQIIRCNRNRWSI